MKIIKNSKELAKLVDENKDLYLKNEDLRVEFEPTKDEIRDVYCRNLFLMNDNEKFNFNGWDFNGWDFNGGKISYYAFFVCYKDIKCTEKPIARRENALPPQCLDGKLIIQDDDEEKITIKISKKSLEALKDSGIEIVE